jgi:iron complex transport system permease protein
MNSHRQITYMTSITIMLILACIADVMWGGHANMDIMLHLRLPRMVTALLAGAAMALSGSQMQSIFRNPLADPHIMGISSGAALGAAITTMYAGVALGGAPIAISAAIGAGAAAAVILYASRKFSNASVLLIFGVMLGFIVTAAVTVLQFSSDAESLKTYYSWSAGSFSNTTWAEAAIIAAALLMGLVMSLRNHKGLDLILFGDEFTELSGASPSKIRLWALLSCSLMTGAVTAFCGPLGFVGIIGPHIAKALLGTSAHKAVLPATLLTGGLIGVCADLISRMTPSPMPVASTMALLGIPVILYIMLKRPSL